MKRRGRPRKERYAKLMGGFWKSEKVRRLSLEARGLLVTAWSYCASEQTDGRVPLEMLEAWVSGASRSLSATARAKRFEAIMVELTAGEDRDGARPLLTVEAGAIDAVAHDWADHNITAEEWERRLDSDRKRKRKGNDIPTGNAPDIPTGNPTGTPAHFQRVALDEDEDEERSLRNPPRRTATVVSARGAPPSSESGLESVRLALLRGYAERYEGDTGEPWMGAARAHTDATAAAAWCVARGQDDAPARVEALLDGAFADPWMRRHRWPWGAIGKDPARYAERPAHGRQAPAVIDPEAARESQRRALALFGGAPADPEVSHG